VPKAQLDDANSTIIRGVRVLSQLVEMGGPVASATLAAKLGLPPSTVHRILRILRDEGYVAKDANANYSPGPALVRLASRTVADDPFGAACESALQTLHDRTGEAAFFGQYLPGARRMRFTRLVRSPRGLRYAVDLDRDHSVLFGASGRAIAAFLPEGEVEAIYAAEADRAEGATPLPPLAMLQAELAAIRAAGVAVSSSQRVEGAHAVAAPVLGRGGQVIGSLGVSMPDDVGREPADLGALVRRQAQLVSDLSYGAFAPDR
jgi:DNA-binding IclR family transcriptional regulator